MTPKLNMTTFFVYVRRSPFGGKLTTAQVEGLNLIIDVYFRLGHTSLNWLAYILATAFHEVGGTMQPIREAHGRSTADTIARLNREWNKPGHGGLHNVSKPYWRGGWFGRGYIQITHEDNYRKMGARLGVDLTTDPDKVMEPEIAAKILIIGMIEGKFRSGHDLDRYFNVVSPADPVGARNIVNGKGDKAKMIATYYKAFKDSLDAASTLTPQPVDVTEEDAEPDDVPVARSGSVATVGTAAAGAAITAAGGVATTAINGISNQWALAAFGLVLALVVIGGGVGLWLALTGRLTILRGRAAT